MRAAREPTIQRPNRYLLELKRAILYGAVAEEILSDGRGHQARLDWAAPTVTRLPHDCHIAEPGKSSVRTSIPFARRGRELVQLKPKHGKRKSVVTPEITAAVNAGDRTWTLLVQGHRDLRRAGMVDKHVPPLQSRTAKPRKKDKKDEV